MGILRRYFRALRRQLVSRLTRWIAANDPRAAQTLTNAKIDLTIAQFNRLTRTENAVRDIEDHIRELWAEIRKQNQSCRMCSCKAKKALFELQGR